MQFYLMIAAIVTAGALGAYYAKQRGRNPLTWLVIGLCFGFLGVIVLFLIPPLKGAPTKQAKSAVAAVTATASSQSIIDRYNQQEWFYLDHEAKHQGPYSFEWLRDLWKQKKLVSQSYVWSEGMENWQRINELPGFDPEV